MKVCLYYKYFCSAMYDSLHFFCGELEGSALLNRFNPNNGVTAVTPTDRPKSVRNRCVIEVFDGFFCVVSLLFGIFCWCRGFCHRTESDLFLFHLTKDMRKFTSVILYMKRKRKRSDSVL